VYPYFFVCGGGGWDSFKVVVAKANGFILLRQLYSRIASIWWLFGWLVVLCGGGLLVTTLWLVVVVDSLGIVRAIGLVVCCLLIH